MKSKMQTCSCRILDFSAILVLKVTLSNRMQKLLFYPRFGYNFPVFYGPLEKVCGYRSTIKTLYCPFIKLKNG